MDYSNPEVWLNEEVCGVAENVISKATDFSISSYARIYNYNRTGPKYSIRIAWETGVLYRMELRYGHDFGLNNFCDRYVLGVTAPIPTGIGEVYRYSISEKMVLPSRYSLPKEVSITPIIKLVDKTLFFLGIQGAEISYHEAMEWVADKYKAWEPYWELRPDGMEK